jgi:hypothetical protein
MKIWISAFIPKVVPDYTVALPPGDTNARTAVPLPAIARLNPLNDGKGLDTGYLTDQRDFDSDITASHRMQSLAILERSSAGWELSNAPIGEHSTSGTTEVNIATGETVDSALADMSRCAYSGGGVTATAPSGATTQIFYLKAAAFDPLVSAAADIDYTATLTLTTTPGTEGDEVRIDWSVILDAFPAFEGYVERDGDVTTLFQIPPPPGNTVADLPGPANRPFSGSVTLFPNVIVTANSTAPQGT